MNCNVYIYIPSYVQPEDGSKKPKHVAERCKFLKNLIKKLCHKGDVLR
jgi:hypothetical protein